MHFANESPFQNMEINYNKQEIGKYRKTEEISFKKFHLELLIVKPDFLGFTCFFLVL